MNVRARMGDAAGVEAASLRCASELRAEFGQQARQHHRTSLSTLVEALQQGAASGLRRSPWR